MNKEVIAVVRLAVGEVGYYDNLSCIHLTASEPRRDIIAGTNCTQLRRSVKSGRLKLLSGSLGEEKKIDFGKIGNKFTGTIDQGATTPVAPTIPVEVIPVKTEPEVITPAVDVVVPPVVEAVPVVDETGIVDIVPVQAPEVVEPITEEIVEPAVEIIVEEVAAEEVVKTSRKKK